MPVTSEKTILIVDDYLTMRNIIINMLTQIGITHIDTANNGKEALKKIRKNPAAYSLVLCDDNIGETMTAFQLLKTVRADALLKEIPFLVMMAEGRNSEVLALQKAGTNAYVVKPFTATTLKEKIADILGHF